MLPGSGSTDLNTIFAAAFGALLILVVMFIAVFERNPTPLLVTVVKIVLSLAIAGIAATFQDFCQCVFPPNNTLRFVRVAP